MRRWRRALIPAAVLCAAAGLRAADPPIVETARLRAFDAFIRLAPRRSSNGIVRIVDFDDETLARLGQWPWPRTRMAALVNRLHALGAGPIVFDIVFAEPDRTSPANVIPLWPATPEVDALRSGALSLPDHDRILADAIAQAQAVTGFALINAPLARAAAPLAKAPMRVDGPDPRTAVIPLQSAVSSLRLFEDAAAGNGHLTILSEPDGMARRVPLLLRYGDGLYPSVVLEALRVAQGSADYAITTRRRRADTELVQVRVGSRTVPTDRHGVAWVYYARPNPGRTIPVWRLLTEEVDPETVRGRMIFVGTSAATLRDLRATPFDPSAAGVTVHAELAEQILEGQFLLRPSWADATEIGVLLAAGALLIGILLRAGAAAGLGFGVIVSLCIAGAAAGAFLRGRLFDPVAPAMGLWGVGLAGALADMVQRATERRRVRRAFSRHLSPALAAQIARHPERVPSGAERRMLTVLMADIRGFAALAERFDAPTLARFMQRFLTPMTGFVLEHQGTIDKYVGDRITAFWNAPLDDPDHARHAASAALAMRRHLVGLNLQLREEAAGTGAPFRPILIGIGIETAVGTAGNLGSAQRFDYSVLGEPVTGAEWLQHEAPRYGADIVIGFETAGAVRDCAVLELDLVRRPDRPNASPLYALLGDASLERDPGFQALRAVHERLLAAFRARRWPEARELLDACLELDTRLTRLRTLYHRYAQRIAVGPSQLLPEDWDGVWADAPEPAQA